MPNLKRRAYACYPHVARAMLLAAVCAAFVLACGDGRLRSLSFDTGPALVVGGAAGAAPVANPGGSNSGGAPVVIADASVVPADTGQPAPDATGLLPDVNDPGPAEDPLLIDDLEDGNAAILSRSGRQGSWFVWHGKTSAGELTMEPNPFMPALEPFGTSQHVARGLYRGYQVAGLGLTVAPNNTAYFDASAYTGVQFLARIAAVEEGDAGGYVCADTQVPMEAELARAEFPVPETREDFEDCDASGAPGPQACNDHPGKNLLVSAEWQTFRVYFAELTQRGFGKEAMFDRARFQQLQFLIDLGNIGEFCLYVDDVKLLE